MDRALVEGSGVRFEVQAGGLWAMQVWAQPKPIDNLILGGLAVVRS